MSHTHTHTQLETCATAVRVVLADRGYAVRALSASLAASPAMPLQALETQQRKVQVRHAVGNTYVLCVSVYLRVCLRVVCVCLHGYIA